MWSNGVKVHEISHRFVILKLSEQVSKDVDKTLAYPY